MKQYDVIVPPGWVHATISADPKQPLTFGAWCDRDYGFEQALKERHPVTLASANTIADGTAVKRVGEKIFPYAEKNIDEVITVADDDLIGAFLDVVENHKMIVENSGLLTVAALRHLDFKNKKVVSILSGGNMDVITMSSVVQHGLIQRDRIFTVSVLIPDIPLVLEFCELFPLKLLQYLFHFLPKCAVHPAPLCQ